MYLNGISKYGHGNKDSVHLRAQHLLLNADARDASTMSTHGRVLILAELSKGDKGLLPSTQSFTLRHMLRLTKGKLFQP